jgi:hypothetical protein
VLGGSLAFECSIRDFLGLDFLWSAKLLVSCVGFLGCLLIDFVDAVECFNGSF